MSGPNVFISYSHDSPEHADRVLQLSDKLRSEGIDCILDQYETSPKEGWPRWMDRNIRSADFVLMICTETYFKRVMGEEEPGKGLGVRWEGKLIYQHLYNADANTKFIPLLFEGCEPVYIPTPLQDATYYHPSSLDGYEDLYRRLTNQPQTEKPELGKLKKLPQRERKPDFLGIKVSLAKLPVTGSDLFGRTQRLEELTDIWQNRPEINILTLVAWGGVGKSALVNKWLSTLGESYGGAERVFGWSFYSQGAAEGKQNSADLFIDAALKWFDDPDPTTGSPWEKGERLAEYVKNQRTLLILDGLEPLQNPPPVETGRLKDPGLQCMLRELARHNPGLVVITTRLEVTDLQDMFGHSVQKVNLENLSPESGAKYLKHLGVDDSIPKELKDASSEYDGHALALTLLGRYIADVYDGDIRKRDLIPSLEEEEEKGEHAKKVINAYEKWFEGKPEQNILQIMGLFDRPAEKGAIDALKAAPAIDGLTNHLQGLSHAKWQTTLKHLRTARLLADKDSVEPDTLDCHPLLREHFGEKLKAENQEAWREGNNRLYEYYKASAKELPDTLEEMAPLFAAVMHGCQAGLYERAYNELYRKRIRRENEYFHIRKLGATGTDLSVLSNFFNLPWSKTVTVLSETNKGVILNTVGYDLRALGRLVEAAQPIRAALETTIAQKDWSNAASDASNLSEIYLTIGNMEQALAYAEQGVQLADRSGNGFIKLYNRTSLGDVQHQKGHLMMSQATFHEAEDIQKKLQPKFPLLYSYQGFRYCDLLLSQGNYVEVERRAKKMLEMRSPEDQLLDIAFDNLSLGRAHLLQSQHNPNHPFTESPTYLNHAVEGLRQAGQLNYLPLGLLARAAYYRVTGDLGKAQKDVNEAFSIASRGGMGLHLADCHLEYARLALARGEKEKAREHWQIAKESIEEMGYHRRDKEVEELEEALSS